jgi:hypothetical protein
VVIYDILYYTTGENIVMKNTRELNGYIVVYNPNHPNCMKSDNWDGWVYEHIMVASNLLGRKIENGEEVHHLNGVRHDNNPSNLIVLSKSDHRKLHSWIENGAAYCESLRKNGVNSVESKLSDIKRCKVCDYPLSKSQKAFCSRACMGKDKRKMQRPTKSDLKDDLRNMSYVKVGKKYGVSDNAVRKWAKTYQII